MAKSVTIRKSLLLNLLLVILLLSGSIMVTTFLASRQTVRKLSSSLISQSIHQTEIELKRFFEPVTGELLLLQSWGEIGLLDTDNPDRLNPILAPIITQNPPISAIILADERGREYMLLQSTDKWVSKQTKRDAVDKRSLYKEWSDVKPEPVLIWKDLNYDPRVRPWYTGALQIPEEGEHRVSWTKPYTFFTTKDPGITASVTYDAGDGLVRVVGIDVSLNDITKFTTSLEVSKNGGVMVLTDDGRAIGLPRNKRYENPESRKAALLKKPDELGWTLASDASKAFAGQPTGQQRPIRFVSGKQAWWGGIKPFNLSPDRTLWISVVVPESDLLGGILQMRFLIILFTLIVLTVAILRAATMARRFSQPIEALVRQSDRISKGDLESGKPVISTITEVHQLAEAHDKMRTGLKTLLKLEGDLQIARQIQHQTFPGQMPSLKGFEIDAWSEPADETGGDTYDVIGYKATAGRRSSFLSIEDANKAMLLLADATGHGIGPALSVTQVRAMLRMAVRMGESLAKIAKHMNEQLHTDLYGGRFITVWLAKLDPKEHTLTSFSAGQAPLLHYHASQNRFDVLDADSPPFGILNTIDITIPDPIVLAPGDIFAVFSDGIFEASNGRKQQFGTERVMKVISKNRHKQSKQILAVLKKAVTDFTEGLPAADDRTALIIKGI
jgi:serine phosphatase RsbU (regulator of sigma subunit)